MRRREFITLLGGAAATWPLAAGAQQSDRVPRIGVLMVRAEDDREGQSYVAAFRRGLTALGWVPGENVEVEYRWQANNTTMAQAFAKELVEFRPDIIVVNATPSLAAMRQATRTIPIVFVGVADPVGQGFVPSLARPGGNITGFGLEEPSMGASGSSCSRKLRRASHALLSSLILKPRLLPVCFCRQWRPPLARPRSR
jgi:putative tryptophan/tyrosine transport system substrate-binding protein